MDTRLSHASAPQHISAMAHRLTSGSRITVTTGVMQLPGAEAPRDRTLPAAAPDHQATSPDSHRKDTFIATLGHELRQPLSALLAAVELLRLSPDSAIATRVTALMRRQIDQMSRVIDDLMDQSRWAHGKLTLRRVRIDARDVIRDAARDIEPAAAARAHVLIVDVAATPLWMDADPQRLHQVLANLLQNAVKYTEPRGRITLSAGRDAANVIVRVRDTGRGIEAGALTRIFDLFAQLRPSADGLGIGLSVAREIVAMHGGRIDARSDGAGRGSEFVVVLPAAESPLAT